MVLFLIGISIAVNNSSHENQTAENPTHQGAHVLPSTLVISLLLIIVVLLTIYCLRFKNHRKALVTSVDKKIPNGFMEEQGEQTVVLLPRSPSPSKRYFPIPLDSLEEEYRIRSADDGKLFREEFNSLPCYYHHGSFEEASREHNREKNRYPNILPYDHSRVVLSHLDGHLCSDYINASYIDGYKEKSKFIAAQGPKPETVADFWRMVWEQKTTTIVMLTNLKERKEDKCYQYWPEKGCWMYGNVRVAMEDFTVLVDYTIRKFCVQYQGSDGPRAPRLVTQLHFTSWPDFGVPFSPIGMLKFLKKVKAVNPSYAGPIVVHCSAGVGRTGTFIVIDSMIDMMHMEQRVDVFGFVSRIREQRCQLIQTDMQYSFIYQALLEYYLYGDTELDVCSLEGHLQRLHNTRAPHDRLGLEEEFRKLTNVRIMKENMRTGNLPANMKKNRVLQIIPYDFNRVILSPVVNQLSDVYAGADVQAITCLLANMAIDRSITSSLSDARDALVNAVVDLVTAYKSNVSNLQQSGLVLPAAMRLFPVYIHALLKQKALRTGTSTRLDERVFAMCDFKTQPLQQLMRMVHPDLYRLDNMSDQGALHLNDTVVPQPPLLHLSAERLSRDGAFLMDCGYVFYLWIGKCCNEMFIRDVLGCPNYASVPPNMSHIPELETPLSERVRALLDWLQDNRAFSSMIHVVKDDASAKATFFQHLVEDRSESASSYYEFLQHIQQQISK